MTIEAAIAFGEHRIYKELSTQVCVGMAVADGTLCVVTAVFISFVLHMTSAVQTTVSIAGLVWRLYGGRWEQVAHKVNISCLSVWLVCHTKFKDPYKSHAIHEGWASKYVH